MAKVSVFGLGKVGYTLACCLAAAGNSVLGYDPIASVVDAVNDGNYETFERDVPERFARAQHGGLRATSSSVEAVINTDISMVVVPTPSNTLGGFSLRFILEACQSIGAAAREKGSFHCVAIVSTVLPGASERYIVPQLERAAGYRLGERLGYCYNPSFIALGEVVNGFERPDYVLIGETHGRAGDVIEALHRSILRNDAPIVRMKLIEAEITKIASNTHETMRVAFANMLFSLCSELGDSDVDIVTGALSYRMGRRFFKGAVPYGGPCWPRDNRALAVLMDAVGVPSVMPRTIDASNDEHGKYVLRKILAATERGEVVGLLGLSYKAGTHVIEGSFGMNLARWLLDDGREVVAWDPMATNEARKVLGDSIRYADDPEHCLRSSKIVMVVNPMEELATIDWSAASTTVVMDPWRCLADDDVSKIKSYVPMGRGKEATNTSQVNDLGTKLRLLNS